MIKPPKIREQMVRLKLRRITIRFWFSRRIPVEGEIADALTKIRTRLDGALESDTDLLADFIANNLPDGTPLAAMEVLLNSNHSGTVDYFEWP